MALTTTRPTLDRLPADVVEKKTRPVTVLATIGALMLVFIGYVIIRWVTSPYYTPVKTHGGAQPPGWMKASLVFWQVVCIPATLTLLYVFVIRPWRRERKVGVDGIILLASASVWIQDPLSSAANHWFVYNTWMVNEGSWAHAIPWWSSYGKPGAMTSEPILFTPAAYVWIFVAVGAIGSAVMRRAKRRWPSLSPAQLVGVCFAAMLAFDVLLEGVTFMPMGVYEYPGGHWSIFANTWHKYPLNEGLTIGAVFTAIAALRYFVNDRGQTLAERGIDELDMSAGRKVVVRALAVTAALQLFMFAFYTVPNTAIGFNTTSWPKQLQERSYFLNNLCGAGTDRACPGPYQPTIRENSVYPNVNGTVTVPKGVIAPGIVPLQGAK